MPISLDIFTNSISFNILLWDLFRWSFNLLILLGLSTILGCASWYEGLYAFCWLWNSHSTGNITASRPSLLLLSRARFRIALALELTSLLNIWNWRVPGAIFRMRNGFWHGRLGPRKLIQRVWPWFGMLHTTSKLFVLVDRDGKGLKGSCPYDQKRLH